MATPRYTSAEFNALTPAERDALGSNYTLVRSATPESLAAGITYDRTNVKYGTPTVPKTSTTTLDEVQTELGLQTPSQVTAPSQGSLMQTLRQSFMTGLRPSANVRTFGGDMALNARRGKSPVSLRIGMSRLDTRKRKEIVARKQKNTLGLNLGSSVGLQV